MRSNPGSGCCVSGGMGRVVHASSIDTLFVRQRVPVLFTSTCGSHSGIKGVLIWVTVSESFFQCTKLIVINELRQ